MAAELPAAVLRSRRRWSWRWLLPLVVVVAASPTAWHAWKGRGAILTLRFSDGRGLMLHDVLRYRGVAVGEVLAIALDPDAAGVSIEVRLRADAAEVARQGSLFWIVHPQIGWGGIEGLDTLAGSRYIEVIPGKGEPQRDFTGLDDTPIAALRPAGGLEVVAQAASRGGIHTGSPVSYRQITVGHVISTSLRSDGGGVDLRLNIDPPFVALVRTRTVFWQNSGIIIRAGLTEGLRIKVDSLETLTAGGIALATPPDGGEPAYAGQHYTLQPESQEEWLKWQPAVAVGPTVAGAQLPHPLHVLLVCHYRELLMAQDRVRDGWALVIPGGLLGPADLLSAKDFPHGAEGVLQISGGHLVIDGPSPWSEHGLALWRTQTEVLTGSELWPLSRLRRATAPEDCLLVADPGVVSIALDQRRLQQCDAGWLIDRAQPLEQSWHGATVVARSDGAIIGILLIQDQKQACVAMLPDPGRLAQALPALPTPQLRPSASTPMAVPADQRQADDSVQRQGHAP
jgi:paraquat-inducible protein B